LSVFGKTEPDRVPGPDASSATSGTVIGLQARFVGDLEGDEDVVVNGSFEGRIRVERQVRVNPGGSVEGEIEAGAVVVSGRVKGQIQARERAELRDSATVEGSIQAPKIVIAEGAQLQGSVAMEPEKKAE
jgi:cytoskeletal protein CcmA (bactofilin family)